MEDRRSSQRYRAADYARSKTRCVRGYFKVLDRETDRSVGYLLDISSEGMMVLSKSFIRENTVLKLRLELPEEIRGSDRLMIDARSVWCERDSDSEFYRAGFSFVSAFPHHEAIIRLLFADDERPQSELAESIDGIPTVEA